MRSERSNTRSYTTPRTPHRQRFVSAALSAALLLAASAAARASHIAEPDGDVTQAASDSISESSFVNGTNWDTGEAPGPGHDYFSAWTLRTPNGSSADFTFGGDSLTIQSGGELAIKGHGEITVDNLIADGGTINHSGVGGDAVARLLGNIHVTTNNVQFNVGAHSTEVRVFNVHSAITGLGAVTFNVLESGAGDKYTLRLIGDAGFDGGIVKTGTGLLVLEGDNSFGGGLVSKTFTMGNANLGAVRLAHANALGQYETIQLGGSSAFTQIELIGGIDFAPTANTTGTIDINANGQGAGGHALKNVSGDNTWRGDITISGGGGATIISSDADTLTIAGNVRNNTGFASRTWNMDGEGDIVITGVIEELTASVLTVLKTGNGSLTLGGANTYTGVTTVNAGTLLVTGSTAAASTVNVNNTSTLGGNGTIGGVVNVASTAFLVPGTSIDTLTVNGNVDLNGALLVEIDELDVNVNDLLDVNALLDITGAAVNFDITGALTQIAYIFATYDDLVGTFTGGDNAPAGYTIDYAYQGNNIALVLIPVPAAMPAGLALLGTVILRRHRLA